MMETRGEFDSMLKYARWSPQEMASEVAAHVRSHLSSVAAVDDDPDRFAEDVDIVVSVDGDGMLVTGTLDQQPVAPYLRGGFDPEQDVADNPLSVPSIEEQP
jgi:hypothetical protein